MKWHKIFLTSNENLKRLKDSSIHLTVTSPPYVTSKFEKGQEFDYDGFLCEFSQVCKEIFRVTVPEGRFALNVADIVSKYRYDDDRTLTRLPLGSDTFQAAQDAGFRLLERFIWDKGYTRNFGGPLLGSYPYPMTIYNNNYFEYIYVLKKPGKRKVSQTLRENSKISLEEWRVWSQQWWRVESQSEKFKGHPAIFPVEIPYRLIRMYSHKGDKILDPYMGTGTTMIAAHKCARRSVGFEIDKSCKGLIEDRIEFDLTDQGHRRLNYDLEYR